MDDKTNVADPSRGEDEQQQSQEDIEMERRRRSNVLQRKRRAAMSPAQKAARHLRRRLENRLYRDRRELKKNPAYLAMSVDEQKMAMEAVRNEAVQWWFVRGIEETGAGGKTATAAEEQCPDTTIPVSTSGIPGQTPAANGQAAACSQPSKAVEQTSNNNDTARAPNTITSTPQSKDSAAGPVGNAAAASTSPAADAVVESISSHSHEAETSAVEGVNDDHEVAVQVLEVKLIAVRKMMAGLREREIDLQQELLRRRAEGQQ